MLIDLSPRLLLLLLAFVVALAIPRPSFSQSCPDLTSYYDRGDPDWPQVLESLSESFSSCLNSSEYFALYGSAQLYSGLLSEAIESLERSLLLNPDNGAAMIDYGEALFQDGQLFAAMEINELLQERSDIPLDAAEGIQQRQARWESMTRQTNWGLELSAGHDNNLNGASDQDSITLTLSGEPVVLSLGEDFRVVAGSLINFRAVGSRQKLSVDSQETFRGEILTRLSDQKNANLAQASGRYLFRDTARESGWQFAAGINYLNYASNSLFTAIDSEVRYRVRPRGTCQPHMAVELQYQTWHDQNKLNGLESRIALGGVCSYPRRKNQSFSADIGLINNAAIKQDRLGGNRDGWQVNLGWQTALFQGQLLAQASYTQLKDQRGYSDLLAFNAQRDVSRTSVLLQYREDLPAFGDAAQIIMNVFYQNQDSNLDLFQTRDTSAQIGISWGF